MSNDNKHISPFIIGITGGTASGKTTVCKKIIESLSDQNIVIISQDDFYKNLNANQKTLAYANNFDFDHPGSNSTSSVSLGYVFTVFHPKDALDWDLMEEVILSLKSGKVTEIPQYDFSTHSRKEGSS